MRKTSGHPKFHGCKNYSVSQKFAGISVWLRKFSGICPKILWAQKLFRVLLETSGHRPKNPLGEKFFCSISENFRALASVAQKIPRHRPKILRVQNYSVAQKFPGILWLRNSRAQVKMVSKLVLWFRNLIGLSTAQVKNPMGDNYCGLETWAQNRGLKNFQAQTSMALKISGIGLSLIGS